MPVTTNTRKLAALLGASGAGIHTDGTLQTAAIKDGAVTAVKVAADMATQAELDAVEAGVDFTPLRQDITILALREAITENRVANNLPNSFIDQFQDDSGIGTETNTSRNASEYVSTTIPLSSNLDFTSQDTGNYLYAAESDLGLDSLTTFTQEAWVYPTDLSTTQGWGVWGAYDQDQWGTAFQLGQWETNLHWWIGSSSGYGWASGTGTTGDAFPASNEDTWHHFAEVFTGSTGKLYWNGTLIMTVSTTSTILFGTKVGIGASGIATRKFKGHLNDWRISNNARYTANFTPSATPFVSDGNTLLLVQSNTTNGSTTFTDSSSNSVTLTRYSGGVVDHSTDVASNLLSIIAAGTMIGNANVPSAAQTKVSGVMLYKDGAGTATIGTDLEIYFTCNGGTNWTEAASYTTVTPVFSTGIKMVKLGETTCTSGSDVRYKAVWANQSAAKDTQLHGIGLNY